MVKRLTKTNFIIAAIIVFAIFLIFPLIGAFMGIILGFAYLYTTGEGKEKKEKKADVFFTQGKRADLTEKEKIALRISTLEGKIYDIIKRKYPGFCSFCYEQGFCREDLLDKTTVQLSIIGTDCPERAFVYYQNSDIKVCFVTDEIDMDNTVPKEPEKPVEKNYAFVADRWYDETGSKIIPQICDDAIMNNCTMAFVSAEDLPQEEAWTAVCDYVVEQLGLERAECCDKGIKIFISSEIDDI